jgi:propionate CoA-transferase
VTKVIDVRDAVGLVRDGATLLIGGSGAGHAVPQRFIDELAAVFTAEGRPRDLTTVRVVGIGDFADRGFSQLGLPGLMRRTIGSNIGNEPRLGALVEANEIEAYSFPQGVLSQLTREIAAGRPGLVTQVGLGTYVDPRQTGGRQNAVTTEDLVEVVTLRGREWLFFHAFPIDVAVIRGTTADEDGNLTMEGEAVQGEMLAMAMAARNSGGIVIAQVRGLARRGSLPQRDVKVPGALVDHVFVDPGQWQTYATQDSPYYAGRLRKPVMPETPLPLDVRKIIARRSLLEFPLGAICNLGFGISQLIGRVAWEEGITDQLVLTVEQGIFGGVPVAGNEGGAGFDFQAMIDQPYMFDFYDGGGLDIASLSFAEVDADGNVNVHAFEGRVRGPGGFPNISTLTPRINFVGTLTAQGLRLEIDDGVRIVHEGSLSKFVPRVREISFNGRLARERGQEVRYITDRAVFALAEDGLVLTELAPGIDLERDVLGRMGFRPRVADDLRTMDRRLYRQGPMGIKAELAATGGDGHGRAGGPGVERPDRERPDRSMGVAAG